MKTRAFLFGGLALLSVSAGGCAWLRSFSQRPRVTLQKVDIVGVDFQAARLRADLELENRVPAAIKLAKVAWGVKIDQATLASGEITQALEIPANGKVPVQIPFTLTFDDLYKISQKYKDADDAPFRLDGTLSVETPVGPIGLPFHHEGTVPVLKVPLVDLAKADVRGVNMSGAEIRFKFNVKNPNKYALDVQSLDYALTLAGAKILDGALGAALAVPAKGQGSFEADVKVSFAQAAAAAQAIVGHTNVAYGLNGNLAAGSPWGTVTSPYAKTGTIKIQQ